jgi:hypothetical protein
MESKLLILACEVTFDDAILRTNPDNHELSHKSDALHTRAALRASAALKTLVSFYANQNTSVKAKVLGQ